MSDMIEVVARAMLSIRVARTDESWQRYREPESWKLFEDDARAAIEALREPTEAMVEAGEKCTDSYYSEEDDFKRGWQAAIDAALSPSTAEEK